MSATARMGGETWSDIEHDYQLVESVCQASVHCIEVAEGKLAHLFLNPAVSRGRSHLTLKVSFNDCQEWNNSKLVYSGPAAYSCIAQLADGRVALFLKQVKECRPRTRIHLVLKWE